MPTQTERAGRVMQSRIAAVMAAVIAALGVGPILGIPSWIILIAAAVPYVMVVFARFGGTIAVISLVFGEFFTLLVVLVVTSATKLPMLASVEITWTVAGLMGCLVVWRGRTPLRVPARPTLRLGLPAFAGAAVWFAAVVASRILPGASQLSWVMRGDSANNILLLRDLLRHHGVALAVGNNPVPLPSAVLSVIAASGRGALAPAMLLRHDVEALAFCFVILIALGCVVAGLAAGLVARAAGSGALLSALSAGAGSLIPLSWFVTGYPIDFGFLDAEVAIPLVLLTFLAYLTAARRPALAFFLLLISATLLLAVWSPLVLVPALLGILVIVRSWREMLRCRPLARWGIAIAAAQLVVYGGAVVLPNLVSLGHLLSAGGSAYGFHKGMLPALAGIALVLGILATRLWSSALFLGAVGMTAATGVGLGALLFISRDQPSVWTYYPVKFAWLCSVVFVVLLVGLAAGLIATRTRSRIAQWIATVGVVVVTVGFLIWTPTSIPGYAASSAVSQVVRGRALGTGDVVADRIFRLDKPGHPAILWASGDPSQSIINFWLLEMRAGTLQGKMPLRGAAYGGYSEQHVSELCRILGLMGSGSTVYSEQAGLQSKLDTTCPGRHATVRVEPGLGSHE